MIRWILIPLGLLILSASLCIFGPPLGFSTVLTRVILLALVWLPVIVIFVWKRIKAVRSASAIERALADQAADHARKVAPDRRDEIDALSKEVLRAISAL